MRRRVISTYMIFEDSQLADNPRILPIKQRIDCYLQCLDLLNCSINTKVLHWLEKARNERNSHRPIESFDDILFSFKRQSFGIITILSWDEANKPIVSLVP